MKKGYKEPPMRFDLGLQKFVPDLVAIKKNRPPQTNRLAAQEINLHG